MIGIENERLELKFRKTINARFDDNNYYFAANEQENLENGVNDEMSELAFISKVVDQNFLPKNGEDALENENLKKRCQMNITPR